MKKVGITLGLALLVGCAGLTPGGKLVKIVNPVELAQAKAQCKEIGPTMGSSEQGDWAAVIDMKNNAAVKNANVIVSSLKFERIIGWLNPNVIAKGIAFQCAQPVQAKFTDAEGM